MQPIRICVRWLGDCGSEARQQHAPDRMAYFCVLLMRFYLDGLSQASETIHVSTSPSSLARIPLPDQRPREAGSDFLTSSRPPISRISPGPVYLGLPVATPTADQGRAEHGLAGSDRRAAERSRNSGRQIIFLIAFSSLEVESFDWMVFRLSLNFILLISPDG